MVIVLMRIEKNVRNDFFFIKTVDKQTYDPVL